MDALFKACEAALRHVIRTHKHDEIIDEKPENDEPVAASQVKIISDNQVSDAVKLQVNLNEACRAFSLHNVNIIERRGHLRLLGVREEEAVRLRAGRKEIKQTDQRTEISKRQKLLTTEQGTVIEQQAKKRNKTQASPVRCRKTGYRTAKTYPRAGTHAPEAKVQPRGKS